MMKTRLEKRQLPKKQILSWTGVAVLSFYQIYWSFGNISTLSPSPPLINEENIYHSASSWVEDCSSHDPCACPLSSSYLMGKGGDIGAMYVVAGSFEFAKLFPPVVDYLRNTLKIPNALERMESRKHDPSGFKQMKWALATEPHICRELLQDVISFFDIIVTIASKNDPPEVQQNATLLLPKPITHPDWKRNQTEKEKELFEAKLLENPNVNKSYVGAVSCPYCVDHDKMFWAKSVKVLALTGASPFETTFFLDTDNLPCYANFTERFYTSYSLPTREWDIAVSQTYGWTDPTKESYWFHRWKWEKEFTEWVNPKKKSFHLHTTRQLVLNLKSKKTLHFLDRYQYQYLYSFIDQINPYYPHTPQLEQPSFGKAAFSMFLHYGPDWKAIHLNITNFCHGRTCGERPNCLVMHKVGDGEETIEET